MADPTATRVARLTPAGRGAVATIAVWGPQAADLVARRFVPHGKWQVLSEAASQPSVGVWPVGDAREEIVLRQTAADAFEIHSHGGLASVAAVIEGLVAGGAVPVVWTEWLTAGVPGCWQQEAWRQLADVSAERPAAILLDQYHGAFDRELDAIAARLAQDIPAGRAEFAALRERARLSLRLTQPFRVVLCGPPNVGKSSLINALLGYARAIASPEPGTTRDVVAAATACGGWPVELSDTAGLRESADPLEAAGIERARQQIAAAELVLWVVDASQPGEADFDRQLPAETPWLVVANKCDLPIACTLPADAWRVSAATGAGIEALTAAIAAKLVPQAPQPGAAVPLCAEQVQVVDAALTLIDHGEADLVASALTTLGFSGARCDGADVSGFESPFPPRK